MDRQKPLELAAKEQVDPNEQDRGHRATLAPFTDADNRAVGLERGLELIRAGAYFEAHEELEDEWREAPAPERDFLQGLVHVAVAWYHAGRDNRPGCERQLEKAARRLGPYRPSHRGVDVESVLAQVAGAQRRVAAGELTLGSVDV
jgi:predicted metal-dependent hydrolase